MPTINSMRGEKRQLHSKFKQILVSSSPWARIRFTQDLIPPPPCPSTPPTRLCLCWFYRSFTYQHSGILYWALDASNWNTVTNAVTNTSRVPDTDANAGKIFITFSSLAFRTRHVLRELQAWLSTVRSHITHTFFHLSLSRLTADYASTFANLHKQQASKTRKVSQHVRGLLCKYSAKMKT